MKKAILVFFLLTVIFFAFSYALFFLSFNLRSPDNLINTSLRKKLLVNYFLRQFFKLRQTGDARFDYATEDELTKLKIVIYYQTDQAFDQEIIQKTVEEIKKIVKKSEGVTIEKGVLIDPVTESVDDEDLQQLIKTYPAQGSVFNKTAILQIFILKAYAPHPSFAGLVKDPYNIFIFRVIGIYPEPVCPERNILNS